tara:strand:- start:266 stop:517 length:252 start_codon:yes stop_codon:yes gene_type:complete
MTDFNESLNDIKDGPLYRTTITLDGYDTKVLLQFIRDWDEGLVEPYGMMEGTISEWIVEEDVNNVSESQWDIIFNSNKKRDGE